MLWPANKRSPVLHQSFAVVFDRNEVHDVIASDAHTAALVRETAARQGKTLEQNTVHLYHVANGKVTESWFYPGDPYADDEFWS